MKSSNNLQTSLICELCERERHKLTIHHLIPRQMVKRKKVDPGPTINICSCCHRQIHRLYTNSYLALHLNTVDKIKDDPKMRRFITWIQKQSKTRVKISSPLVRM